MLSTRELAALAKALAGTIKEHVGVAVGLLSAEIGRLEKRLDAIPEPQPLPDIAGMLKEAVAALPAALDGKSITVEEAAPIWQEMIDAGLSALPKPANGKDADPEVIRQLVAEQVAGLPPARDGKDADAEAIKAAVLAELPPPEPGKGADPAEIQAMVQRAVDAIPRPADGKSVTLDEIKGLLDHMQATWALDFERRAQTSLERAIDRMPKAKDGENGKNGADGLGFDDLIVEHDGARGVTIKFQRGDQVKSFALRIPTMIYRGIFQPGGPYDRGDTVTWGGSLWHCDEATADKPGEIGSKGWTLAAKRGRDGKDGERGKDYAPPQPVKV